MNATPPSGSADFAQSAAVPGVGAAGDRCDAADPSARRSAARTSPAWPLLGAMRLRSWWYQITSIGWISLMKLDDRRASPARSPDPCRCTDRRRARPSGSQPSGKLRLRSTRLAFVRRCGVLAVRVHRLDQPQVDAIRAPASCSRSCDDRHARRLRRRGSRRSRARPAHPDVPLWTAHRSGDPRRTCRSGESRRSRASVVVVVVLEVVDSSTSSWSMSVLVVAIVGRRRCGRGQCGSTRGSGSRSRRMTRSARRRARRQPDHDDRHCQTTARLRTCRRQRARTRGKARHRDDGEQTCRTASCIGRSRLARAGAAVTIERRYSVPSSSGLGHHPLKVAARVRIP